jgi:predicted transcriptional regulator
MKRDKLEKHLTIRLSADLSQWIEKVAEEEETSTASVIRRAVKEFRANALNKPRETHKNLRKFKNQAI